MTTFTRNWPRLGLALAAFGLAAAPLAAQVETIDPNNAIDGDLVEQPGDQPVYGDPAPTPSYTPAPQAAAPAEGPAETYADQPQWSEQSAEQAAGEAVDGAGIDDPATTYREDDLIGAAEGVFGKGAEGLAGIIEKVLKDQGRPNAYIAGREASGAFVVGLRYGSGTLNHKIEGKREVYWTGPSIGFDVGGNAANTFVLVYNLYDTQDLYHRFPAAEGTAYLVGGFTASYLRWGDVVLIPIRLGVGYRLGVNAGYMKFTEKRNWLPF